LTLIGRTAAPETSLCTPAATTYQRSERKRSKGGRRTAGGRRESCDELRTRTQRNHRLVRRPEDGSAYPQRPLAHAFADAACANQPSIRLVVTEQDGSAIRLRPFGVRLSDDHELRAVEAFGLDPGAAWRRTGLSAIRPGLFPCMQRALHWKRQWAYSSWSVDPTRRACLKQVRGRRL
jgi:hypothetical protein